MAEALLDSKASACHSDAMKHYHTSLASGDSMPTAEMCDLFIWGYMIILGIM